MLLIKITVASAQPEAIKRYQNRISGPLLDRIDLHIDVPPLHASELQDHKPWKTRQLYVNA